MPESSAADRHYALRTQHLRGPSAAGLAPNLVSPKDIQIRVAMRTVAHFVQDIGQNLKLDGEFAVNVGEGVAAKSAARFLR